MKYYIDTEFQEGFHKPLFGKSRHFIDLISIGLVAEDGREYYAISNEFDLKAVWGDDWLRENVLKPIHKELCAKQGNYSKTYHHGLFEPFTLKSMQTLIKWYGKPNKWIAEDVKAFVLADIQEQYKTLKYSPVEFYGYYADYDWVVFCSIFGRMIDLPAGFPMYCRDLKQIMDEKGGKQIKEHPSYPKQTNEHNALADAHWNKALHKFLNNAPIQQAA